MKFSSLNLTYKDASNGGNFMSLGLIEAKLLHFFLRNTRFPITNKNIYTLISEIIYGLFAVDSRITN
jgi:hypothetical protein